MNLCDLNPHIRFATALQYEMRYNRRTVKVADCRIFYVTDGSAQLLIGENRYDLTPGSLFYCCAGSIYSVNTNAPFSLISINFDLSQSHCDHLLPISPVSDPEEMCKLPVFAETVHNSSILNSHVFMENAHYLQAQLQQIVEDHSGIDLFARELSSARLKLLLISMHSANPGSIPDKILFTKNYIQKHYAEKITNKALGDLVGYHEYYLNRIFHSHIGMNLHDYLLKIRLNHASSLLLSTELPLQSIAESSGFNSYAHFSAYFKQTYGLSPTKYRKQMKGNI